VHSTEASAPLVLSWV